MEKAILENKTISIIGLGNMGKAIQLGIIKKKVIKREFLLTSNKQSTNKKVARLSNVLILCVKPQIITSVLRRIKPEISRNKLIISIAAGVKIKTIKNIIGKKQMVVRVMPNLAAPVNKSISCWVRSKEVSAKYVSYFKKIFQSIGQEIEVKDEKILDQITPISGSGPAYYFYLTELLENSARRLGLNKELACVLARQTLIGSSELIKKSNLSPRDLRYKVTSKGGITEAVFKKLDQVEMRNIFYSAVKAGHNRALEISLNINKGKKL